REAEPQAGKSEKLAEGSQHDDVAAAHLPAKTGIGGTDIHEGLLDHEKTAAALLRIGKTDEVGLAKKAPVGIVRVRHDGKIGVHELGDVPDLGHAVPRERSR